MGLDDLVNKAKDLMGGAEAKADEAQDAAQAGDQEKAAAASAESSSLMDKAKDDADGRADRPGDRCDRVAHARQHRCPCGHRRQQGEGVEQPAIAGTPKSARNQFRALCVPGRRLTTLKIQARKHMLRRGSKIAEKHSRTCSPRWRCRRGCRPRAVERDDVIEQA